ncbi:MAG: type VI secretion system Vgr family protein [Aquabacterium sp.]
MKPNPPAGVDAGTNHPGTISGWHSPHLDGGGANQWLIDDATGQLRMRLASHSGATGWSELSLGHLIQQSGRGGAGCAQGGAWLGEGFYGHTDGWAVVRAGQGLLLSISARPAMGASVQSTQMDPAAQGNYDGAAGGQEAKKAQPGSRTLQDPVERFAKPLLHLDTPASAVFVTPDSIGLLSGQDTSLTTQGDVQLTAADSGF